MKRLIASLILSMAAVALSGCYIDPGYSHVRQSSYQGDAYYGHAVRTYDDGYYAAPIYGGYYGPGYGYGYVPGVSLGISGAWYGGSTYHRGRAYRGNRGDYRGGHWQGRRSDGHSQGDHRQGQRSDRPTRNDRRQGQRHDRPARSDHRQGQRSSRPTQGTHRDGGRRDSSRHTGRRVER